jgi:hypothetical protein
MLNPIQEIFDNQNNILDIEFDLSLLLKEHGKGVYTLIMILAHQKHNIIFPVRAKSIF